MFKQLENRLIVKSQYVIADWFTGHFCNLTLLDTNCAFLVEVVNQKLSKTYGTLKKKRRNTVNHIVRIVTSSGLNWKITKFFARTQCKKLSPWLPWHEFLKTWYGSSMGFTLQLWKSVKNLFRTNHGQSSRGNLIEHPSRYLESAFWPHSTNREVHSLKLT